MYIYKHKTLRYVILINKNNFSLNLYIIFWTWWADIQILIHIDIHEFPFIPTSIINSVRSELLILKTINGG